MPNESGNSINITNFKNLTASVGTLGADYAPNANINIAALTAKITSAEAANNAVAPAYLIIKEAQNTRQGIFAPLEKTLTAVMGVLKSTDATPQQIADANSIVKQIRGKRTSEVVEDDPNTPEDESSISASHRSYIKRTENFYNLIELLKLIPTYTPTEANLTIASLETFKDAMKNANENFGPLIGPYASTRNARNIELYHPVTGLVQRAKQVKEYLKKFGTKSVIYTTANQLKFRTLVKVQP